jgi:2'-5' RNA ligase superfamily
MRLRSFCAQPAFPECLDRGGPRGGTRRAAVPGALRRKRAAGHPSPHHSARPFMPPQVIDAAVLGQLERLFAAAGGSRFRLDHTDWFDDEVLWLGLQDPAPFRALTRGVYQAFPAFPPFEGKFDEVVPHLTVGHGHALSDLRAAEEAVRAHLPIDARAGTITL